MSFNQRFQKLIALTALSFWSWTTPVAVVSQSTHNPSPMPRQAIFGVETYQWDWLFKILGALGGLSFIATAFLALENLKIADKNREIAEKNYQLTEEKQVTERFAKAVELLSDTEKLDARIGGIYLLERIAKDSAKDRPVVMEVLTAYIRERSKLVTFMIVSADIQAAISVIARRDAKGDSLMPNLNHVDFEGACFQEMQLEYIDFYGANLGRGNFFCTNLRGANLRIVNLEGANLTGAILEEVKLRGANLSDSMLKGASLYKAELESANFDGAILKGVNSI